jgi:NCAIR mutase (PurE)-related protein
MDATDLDSILGQVAAGSMTPEEASAQLARLPFADLDIARLDHHRSLRQGFPEAVYGPGKSTDEVGAIVAELLASGTGPVIVTRAGDEQVSAAGHEARALGLEGCVTRAPVGSTVVFRPAPDRARRVVIVTAGTADGPVAEECAAVLHAVGLRPTLLRDRGVAGLHRLAGDLEQLFEAEATIVVAGMEGALASVVGGIVRGPVIAVPTSVGYGAALEGVTALLAMMASCAAGVSVMGIDNGFGAALAVVRAFDLATGSSRGA